jgi:hypothetical protein
MVQNWAECHCGMVNVMNIPDRHLPSEDNRAFRYEVVSAMPPWGVPSCAVPVIFDLLQRGEGITCAVMP